MVKLFFQKSSPEIKGHCIWFLGAVLRDFSKIGMDEKSKQAVINRIMDLYEWRIEEARKANGNSRKELSQELKWFGFWFINSQFSKDWAMSQLQATLELTSGEISFATPIVDKLQGYVEDYPLDALRTLILLIEGDTQGLLAISSKERIEALIKSIMDGCDKEEIEELFNQLVSLLTKKGYLEFAEFYIK